MRALAIVACVAAASLDLSCASIAHPDYSLEDHWNNGEALRVIRAGGCRSSVAASGNTL